MTSTTTEAEPRLQSYTVTAAAVTITTGEKNIHSNKPEVARVLKGGTIQAPADHPTIQFLLHEHAIRLTEKIDGTEALTARAVYLLGMRSQEVAEVDQRVVPMTASAQKIAEETE